MVFQYETVFKIRIKMLLLQIGGLAICFSLNLLLSHTGHKWKEDRDFFIPPASILFAFYSLIIVIPEAHYKLINYSSQGKTIDQDQIFPYAFLISLLSITASMIIDKFYLKEQHHMEDQTENHSHKIPLDWSKDQNTLQFLLTLSITLQNVVNFYFICVQKNDKQLVKEIMLFLLFTLIINFSHGYILAQTGIDSSANLKLAIFMNSGMIVGFFLSLFLEPDMALLVLPCISAGIQLYCSIFICFPYIFPKGQNMNEDKSHFLAILIAFLVTVIYYPICYLLRI